MENDQENQIALLKQYLENAQANLNLANSIMQKISPEDINESLKNKAAAVAKEKFTKNTKIVEGIFDGQNMVGPDGKMYSIPPNYASKSKLVEGDILKLTIMPDGSFVYKQIRPVDRKRIVGELVQDQETKEFKVLAKGRSYKVILASVTYYKGDNGDHVVVLVPKDQDSKWAAIENIVKEGSSLTSGFDDELTNGNDFELPDGAALELPDPSAMLLEKE